MTCSFRHPYQCQRTAVYPHYIGDQRVVFCDQHDREYRAHLEANREPCVMCEGRLAAAGEELCRPCALSEGMA